jgi:hypothetical protein
MDPSAASTRQHHRRHRGWTAALRLATVLTHDVVWGMLSGISTAIAIGFALYSVGTWDRGW